jgi:hypothetical protein
MKQDIFFNTSVYKSDIKETFWDLHIQRVTEISTLILTSNRTRHDEQFFYVLSRAINVGRQCHFKIWLDCHKFKKFPCLIMPTLTKCQKIEKKMTINFIQHDDRL